MDFFKTYDKDGFLRIEEDGGAALSLYLYEKYACLISIKVPERDRRKGIGSALLSAADGILAERGIGWIEADFTKSLPGFFEFVNECGFETVESAPVYSMDIDDLLSSAVLKNALKKKVKGAGFSFLSKLEVSDWSALFSFVKDLDIHITNSDFQGFDKDISGVVFDKGRAIKAFVLCSRTEGGILIEFLSGDARKNPGFIMEALKGVTLGIAEAYASDTKMKNLFLIAANDGVKGLISTFEKGGLKPEVKDMCVFAKRTVSKTKKNEGAFETAESPDENAENLWRRETEGLIFQKNISFKLPFSRRKNLA